MTGFGLATEVVAEARVAPAGSRSQRMVRT
ncbi:MAG: hypothetical protein QOJ29_1810, partial [Thermoleophilaceae bacterium]|nr:hypothetical protein [Thermoleophilaceae bacterium]